MSRAGLLCSVLLLLLPGLGCNAVPRLQRFAAELPYELEHTAYRWSNWFLRLPDETSRFAQRAATGFGAGPVYTTAPVYTQPQCPQLDAVPSSPY